MRVGDRVKKTLADLDRRVNQTWPERIDFTTEAHDALNRLLDTREEYPADAHETYFTANGENYRIRIERIPDDGSTRRKGEHER